MAQAMPNDLDGLVIGCSTNVKTSFGVSLWRLKKRPSERSTERPMGSQIGAEKHACAQCSEAVGKNQFSQAQWQACKPFDSAIPAFKFLACVWA
jgi:hypothetical protein